MSNGKKFNGKTPTNIEIKLNAIIITHAKNG